MSKGLGIGVFVVGLLGLGWWAHGHDAPRIESKVQGLAEAVVAGSVHGVTAAVSGRDIHLSGIANGQAEADALMAQLRALDARRKVTSEMTVLETISPFTFAATRDGAGMGATGHIPTEALRADLAGTLGDSAAGLTLAAGAPDGWADLAKAGLGALGALDTGQLRLSDNQLDLTGEAAGPDEAAAVDAALATLPQGNVTKSITLLDDGTPAAWTLDYSASNGATASGKLPKGLDLAAIAKAMGLSAISGEVKQAMMGEMADLGMFAAIKDVMGQIETLKLTATPEAQRLDIGVQGGVDTGPLQEVLSAKLPGMGVTLSTVTATGENGQRRTNAATGADERFMGGYWLAVPQIDLGLQGCQSAADAVLANVTINFVTGSDALDVSAIRVVNDLAAILARCAEDAGLRAVIGGHTDNVGDATANLGLSQRRATAVRREMLLRGVPGSALKAVGFGDALPIADNSTDDGRAKNRRTTIQWSE